MNREIKFRVWFNGGMYDDADVKIDWVDGIVQVNTTIKMAKEQGYILMQYTGLKDKNGKEIYGGDIIIPANMHDSNINYWVSEDGGVIGLPQEIKWENFSWSLPVCPKNIEEDWEVVGNIYENPELLEAKQ